MLLVYSYLRIIDVVDYIQSFAAIFVQIKIELVGSKPLIWRRVTIPAGVTFKRLHDTIQFSLDWWDRHLYKFEFPQEKLRITNDEEAYEEYKFIKKNTRARH